jgi:hypothetical protein
MAPESIGYDGHRSPEYTTFEKLRAVATDAEMIALLHHSSPVVRTYAAEHVVERELETPALETLLTDATTVQVHYGCMVDIDPVSRVTVQSLCNYRGKPFAATKLSAIAGHRDDLGDQARRCLALAP